MTIWIIAIIALNLYVLVFTEAPPFVKLNAAMVTLIALIAVIRIWQKKRQRRVEQLHEEVLQLQRENEELRQKIGTPEAA